MPSGVECVCCKEIPQIVNKLSSEGVECIIVHPGFESVCLSIWVLETAYYSYRQHYGAHAIEGAPNEYVLAVSQKLCVIVVCLQKI